MALEFKKKYDDVKKRWEIALRGEIDISTVQSLKETLEEAFREKKSDISLVLSDLEYIDSTGLGAIIGAYGRMKEKGKDIVLIKPSATLKKLLAITSLNKVFVIEED